MEIKYKEIIEHIGTGICVVDFNMEFLYANNNACEIFETTKNKLEGRNLKDFVNEIEWEEIKKQTEQLKTEKSGKYHLEIKTNKNNLKILSVYVSVEFDKTGNAIYFFGGFYDITENVYEKKKLIEINHQFEELNQKLFSQTLEAEAQKEKIEKYSKYLDEGINYAKTIQKILLPDLTEINNILPETDLIFYKPKHIIGGDFYYINEKNNYKIFAVADCTGHGVSGALISMLGITFLNDIIDRNLLVNSSEILEKLREKIKKAFKSYGNNIENKNGMDIAICIVDKKTNIMQYSGANNPLWIYRDDELLEYKPTRNPIGFYHAEKKFQTQHIQLKKNDYIFLFSDGFYDQIGEEHNRKYSKKKFRKLLLEIKSFEKGVKENKLNKELINWKGKNEQIDDITIMGIKW